jgi:hypothetical protein
MMTELLLKRAREVAPAVDPAESSLLIVAHGTQAPALGLPMKFQKKACLWM